MTEHINVVQAMNRFGLTRAQILDGIETGAIKAWPVSKPGAKRIHWRMTAEEVKDYRDTLRGAA